MNRPCNFFCSRLAITWQTVFSNLPLRDRFRPVFSVPLWLGLAIGTLAQTSLSEVEIKEVEVRTRRGTQIDPQSVYAFIETRPGMTLSRPAISRDVKALEVTRRYAFVEAEIEEAPGGVNLIFIVDPRPFFRTLTVEGNKLFSDKKIKNLLDFKRGELIDEAELALRIQEVRAAYRKKYYPDADITYRLVRQGDSGVVDVLIDIKEGRPHKVTSVVILGNEALSDKELREVMEVKAATIWSFISGSGKFERGELEADKARIRERYRESGYLEAEVVETRIDDDGTREMQIILTINEGPQYHVGQIRIFGLKRFTVEQVRRNLGLKTGDVASTTAIDKARKRIRDYYAARGYRTRINTRTQAQAGRPVIDVVFEVNEGPLTYVRNVSVSGNIWTQDKVVLRELLVLPGDVLNESKVELSERRLRSTGLFRYVGSAVHSTPDTNEVDVVFDVSENKTGNLGAALGFSSIEQGFAMFSFSQGNFDISDPWRFKGAGEKFQVSTEVGNKTTRVRTSWADPWFMDRKLRLGVSMFHNESRYFSEDYDQRNTGGTLSLSKPIAYQWRGSVGWNLERIEVHNVSTNAPEYIQVEEGTLWQSGPELGVSRDTRDRPRFTRTGNKTSLTGTITGGPFGLDVDIYRLRLASVQYVPALYDHTLKFRGRTTVVEEWNGANRVPIFDRLFLGGARTVRGFDYREVGPKNEDGDDLGGKTEFYFTAEYDIPIVERFSFATFFDMGFVAPDAYDWDFGLLNSSYGVGIRVAIPGFPLQLDYSWPLETDEFNDRSSGRFSFLLGHSF